MLLLIISAVAGFASTKLTDLSAKYHTYLTEPTQQLSDALKNELYEEYVYASNKKSSTTRNQIFKNTLDEIVAHNSNKSHTWKKGLTQFTDMTHEEFARLYTMQAPQNCSATVGTHVRSERVPPPSRDWRKDNMVSPVKNQGHCGSCWTFSTTGCLEAHGRIYLDNFELLSEQQLVDCAQDFDNHGCNGGLPSHAFEYISAAGGINSEEDYAYQAVQGNCTFDPFRVVSRVPYGAVNITALDEGELADAIGNVGPVSVAFQVVPGFKDYTSGVYKSDDCKNGPLDVNHAVLAVGYDVDADSGLPYYIVKNSWSESWGIDGYFWILKDANMCGIGNCNSYPNLGQPRLAGMQPLEV